MTALAIVAGLALPAGAALLLGLRRSLVLVTVRGLSMSPVLMPGDRLLVSRLRRRPGAGEQLVLQRPEPGAGWAGPVPRGPGDARWYVKRVVAAAGDPVPPELLAVTGSAPGAVVPPGRILVTGEHEHSEDSRQWGYFPADRILGTVVARIGAGPAVSTRSSPAGR
ncbi:S26 family signal peptidase [Kitasatospora sp. NPDC004240]